jgi:hypothetical protein
MLHSPVSKYTAYYLANDPPTPPPKLGRPFQTPEQKISFLLKKCYAERIALIERKLPLGKPTLKASRASSYGVRSDAKKHDKTEFPIYVAHSGALGGLANCREFLRAAVAAKARRFLVPNENRGGRLSESGVRLVLNLLGLGVIYARDEAGVSAGRRERAEWWEFEDSVLSSCCVVASVSAPEDAVVKVMPGRWLCKGGRRRRPNVVLYPGINCPPLLCVLVGALVGAKVVKVEEFENGSADWKWVPACRGQPVRWGVLSSEGVVEAPWIGPVARRRLKSAVRSEGVRGEKRRSLRSPLRLVA